MHIFNISVTYLQIILINDILKALGGVDFKYYALLAINQYMQWSRIGLAKNAVNLSKSIFSSLNFHMHIFNMTVTNLKALGNVNFTRYALLDILQTPTVRTTKLDYSCNTDLHLRGGVGGEYNYQ